MIPIFGLDLGQRKDYSALVVIYQHKQRYNVVGIKRWKLGTPYQEIATDLKAITSDKAIDPASAIVVVDETGVGVPVAEMVTATLDVRVIPVWITGGAAWRYDKEARDYKVAKQLLCSCVHSLLGQKRIGMNKASAEYRTLTSELDTFDVKISKAANELYAAREGTHDDLVLACALGLWAGENLCTGPWEVGGTHRSARSVTEQMPRGLLDEMYRDPGDNDDGTCDAERRKR